MSVICVKNLCKEFRFLQKEPGFAGSIKSLFRSNYKSIAAVDNVSFDVNEAEMLAFIGPNGAGKSTTIKILTDILYPTSGSASVLGLTPWKPPEKLEPIRKKIPQINPKNRSILGQHNNKNQPPTPI